MHGRFGRENGSHNRRREEGQALHRNVVQQEDHPDGQGRRRKDALLDGSSVQLVQDDGGSDLFSLDSGDGQVLFLLGQPLGSLDSVGHQAVGGDADNGSDDTFDQEDLLPSVD